MFAHHWSNVRVGTATLLVVVGGFLMLTAASAATPPPDGATILVQFKPKPDSGKGNVADLGDVVVGEMKTRTLLVKIKDGQSIEERLAAYRSREDVEYAEPNVTMSAALGAPNDPSYASQWGLSKIKALDAWAVTPGSYHPADGVPVAIVDSGVDAAHPDLSGRVLTGQGATCLTGTCVSGPATDDYGHGTHVAGISGAAADDLVGVAGAGFGSPVIPVKVLDSLGNGSAAAIATGIIWAADQGARVVNLSLGGTSYSQTVCDAVTYALSQGAVVVAAAGNNTSATAFYPAACPGAVGVAATTSTDTLWSASNTGYPNVFIAAPGDLILSDGMGGTYLTASGTSMAAPFVTGVAGLLLSQDPARTPANIKGLLAVASDKIGSTSYSSDPFATCVGCTWNASFGHGRLNAYRAVTAAVPAPGPDFTIAASPTTATTVKLKASYTISTSALNGFTGTVSFSVLGLPTGATAAFSPTSVAGSGRTTLTVTATTSTPVGSYTLVVKGTSGALSRSVNVTFVRGPADFALLASPTAASIYQTEKAIYTLSLDNQNGFASTVSLALGGLPTGATAAWSATSISGTKTATLTVTTTSSTPAGSYTLTVTGTSGSLVRTLPLGLSVATAVPMFTLGLTPTSTNVTFGRAKTIAYTLSATPKFGFKGIVALSVTGVPTGATGTFKATSLNITSTTAVSTTYSLVLPSTMAKGIYTVTFTGTAGSIVQSRAATITVA